MDQKIDEIPEDVRMVTQKTYDLSKIRFRKEIPPPCDDCKAQAAFQATRDVDMGPAFNTPIYFDDIIPSGRRAVIELVTASILIPKGEWARLRMYTGLGTSPSNLDLYLVQQGVLPDANPPRVVLVATHSLRAYTDGYLQFNVHRDNAVTTGYALICISGYIVS